MLVITSQRSSHCGGLRLGLIVAALIIFIPKEETYLVISIVQRVGQESVKGGNGLRHESTSASSQPNNQQRRVAVLPLRHRRSSTVFEAAIEGALDGMRRKQPNTNSEPTRRQRFPLAIGAKGRGRRSLGFRCGDLGINYSFLR
jgi:hypothetical protein